MARIVEHLPVAELEARYRAAQDVTEARHLQAIWLLAQGRTVLEVAEVLAFVPPWGAGRPAAAEWPGGKPAHPRGAVRLGRAAEAAARGWRAVERPQGRGLDGAASWSGGGASAARLGGAEAARVVAPGPAAAAAPPHGYARAAGGAEKKLD